VSFWDPDSRANSCDVTGVKIRMISHNVGNENDDSWNLDSFTMHGYSDGGSLSYYLSAHGNPLKRFTARSQWWEKRE
jgi:hypothetical protein